MHYLHRPGSAGWNHLLPSKNPEWVAARCDPDVLIFYIWLMTKAIRLSVLLNEIQEAMENRFEGDVFRITAEITDVKKYAAKKWCFLKFIEKHGSNIAAEIKGVLWNNAYHFIPEFEQLTRRPFQDGLEITCVVRVKFHPRYGLTLEVLEIDYSYEVGKMELDRQVVLARLVSENPGRIRLEDGQYVTINNRLPLPCVLQHIALITAPGSDGQRDFIQELKHNRYGYRFAVKEYLVQIQGDRSTEKIIEQLELIGNKRHQFDVVAIVRGGGSQTDFKPFDDYELSKLVATYPVPVLTGIGHDRNISVVDLMARPLKTPTKSAAFIVDHNFSFEQEVLALKESFFRRVSERLQEEKTTLLGIRDALPQLVSGILKEKKTGLDHLRRLTKNLSPSALLAKGFALVMTDDQIITDPGKIKEHALLKTVLKTTIIHSTVTEKTKYENRNDL